MNFSNLATYVLCRAQEELEAAAADLSLARLLVRETGPGGDARVLAEAVEREAAERRGPSVPRPVGRPPFDACPDRD
jgi:hypothetical protein